MRKALHLILLYLAFVLLPVTLVTFLAPDTDSYLAELGKDCALVAFAILVLQFVLAPRFKWLERPFGFDIVIRFHQHMALFALSLLIAHPLLLALNKKSLKLLIGLKLPWYIWAGKIGLLLLFANVLFSRWRRPFKISFEKWQLGHDTLAPLLLAVIFVHSWRAGHDDLVPGPLRPLWLLAATVALLLFIYHKRVRPAGLRKRPYTVTEVRREADKVWTVEMKPPAGEVVPEYLPGQFHFVTFFREPDLPVEEHHWTISSSPTDRSRISSTIKELGDFTATIGRTKAGDTAAVHGAFGRFSCALHPEEKDLVFIAGGIGITPLMSMLRYMRDRREECSVLLLYGNNKRDEIVFGDELAAIEAGGRPRLRVVHVLNKEQRDWQGERGFIDGEKIDRLCGLELTGKTFYVCGPPPMLRIVIAALKERDVADQSIRTEIFSFVD